MKYIVLGSKGQLGIEFLSLLKDEEVFEYDLHNIDITKEKELKEVIEKHKPDVILNCAAYNQVDLSEKKKELAFKVNRDAPINLAKICTDLSIKLVHYSTNYVFDGKKSEEYEIDDIPNPLSIYGSSKLEGEQGVLKYNKNALVIRTSWVFGKGVQNFIHKLKEWSSERVELMVSSDEISAPTSTKDLANITLQLLDKNYSGLFHVTNRGSCSRYEWAKVILNELGWKGHLLEASMNDFNLEAARPPRAVLSLNSLPPSILSTLPTWKEATIRYIKDSQMI